MQDLELGSIANPDENRMVGHYWLRNPELAPSAEIKNLVSYTVENIQQFSQKLFLNKFPPTYPPHLYVVTEELHLEQS